MKSLLLKYNILIFLLVLFSIGAFLFVKATGELNLQDARFTDYKTYRIVCSDREKAGKRYLWIKSKEADTLSSLGRVKNCEKYHSIQYKSLEVKYRPINNTIYSLTLDGEEIISIQDVIKQGNSAVLMMYFVICIILAGLYYGFRKQFIESVKTGG